MIYTITFNPALDYTVSVDEFKLGMTNRTKTEQILPGGKGINVSVVLKNLDFQFETKGFVGVYNWIGILSGALFITDTNPELAKTIFEKYMHVQTDEQVINYYFLKEVMDNSNYIFEREFIYHQQGLRGKYWKIYNLNTPEKVKKFIDNSWILTFDLYDYFSIENEYTNYQYFGLVKNILDEINAM